MAEEAVRTRNAANKFKFGTWEQKEGTQRHIHYYGRMFALLLTMLYRRHVKIIRNIQ